MLPKVYKIIISPIFPHERSVALYHSNSGQGEEKEPDFQRLLGTEYELASMLGETLSWSPRDRGS